MYVPVQWSNPFSSDEQTLVGWRTYLIDSRHHHTTFHFIGDEIYDCFQGLHRIGPFWIRIELIQFTFYTNNFINNNKTGLLKIFYHSHFDYLGHSSVKKGRYITHLNGWNNSCRRNINRKSVSKITHFILRMINVC